MPSKETLAAFTASFDRITEACKELRISAIAAVGAATHLHQAMVETQEAWEGMSAGAVRAQVQAKIRRERAALMFQPPLPAPGRPLRVFK